VADDLFQSQNRAEEILSTDIWLHFQSIEINLGGVVSCRQNDAEEKPCQKEGRGRRLVSFILHSN